MGQIKNKNGNWKNNFEVNENKSIIYQNMCEYQELLGKTYIPKCLYQKIRKVYLGNRKTNKTKIKQKEENGKYQNGNQ